LPWAIIFRAFSPAELVQAGTKFFNSRDLRASLVSIQFFSHSPPMQTAVNSDFISVKDYLAAEEVSDVRHEYLGGLVCAVEHETRDHNQIIGNLLCAIHPTLKKVSGRLYAINVALNFKHLDHEYFYYPDVVVTCDKRDTHPRFIRHPKLLIEVLSESTERVDKREKFFAHTSIASLEEYVRISQSAKEVTLFRRANTIPTCRQLWRRSSCAVWRPNRSGVTRLWG